MTPDAYALQTFNTAWNIYASSNLRSWKELLVKTNDLNL